MSTEESVKLSNFDSIKHDPEIMIQLLNKYVKLQLIKNTAFEGFVRSIDPITCSIILSVPKGDSFQTTLVPGHAIVEVLEIPTELQPPSHIRQSTNSHDEDVRVRKARLKQWFEKNMLPTSEVDNNIVVGSASVLPPYSVMNIYAENPVVVAQVRKVMQQMPDGEF